MDVRDLAKTLSGFSEIRRLFVQDCNPLFLSPFHELFTDVFGASIDLNGVGFASSLDV